MKSYKTEKSLSAVESYDVVVLGAGPAGWTAAVSAARHGCRTAVVERFGFPGGAATAGLVVPLSGMYFEGERVMNGIPAEFCDYLVSLGGARFELPKGHFSFDPETYKLAATRFLRRAGVDMFMDSYLSGSFSGSDRRVEAVSFENKNGTELIEGDFFIDATGDADLFRLSGLPMTERTAPLQPVSLCFVIDGADTSTPLLHDYIRHDGAVRANSCQTEIQKLLTRLYEKGEAPLTGGPWFNTLVTGSQLCVNVTRACADATDNRTFTAAQAQLREDMFAVFSLLKNYYPEFRSAYISASAAQAGIRETRHILGRHLLTGEELMSGVFTEDTVAYAAHPVDIHLVGSGQILKRLTKPGAVPLGSMVCRDSPNIAAAGRCICADREAYASVRVQATVMAMGEAAGAAAWLCVSGKKDIRELEGSRVRNSIGFRKL